MDERGVTISDLALIRSDLQQLSEKLHKTLENQALLRIELAEQIGNVHMQATERQLQMDIGPSSSVGSPVRSLSNRTIARLEAIANILTNSEGWMELLDAMPDAIIIADSAGLVIMVNRQTELLFGYHRDDMIGLPVENLMPERFRKAHDTHRIVYSNDPQSRPMGQNLDLFCLRKDLVEVAVEISLSPLVLSKGIFTVVAIRKKRDKL